MFRARPTHFPAWFLLPLVLLCSPPLLAQGEPVSVRLAPARELAIFREFSAPATVVSLNDSHVAGELQAVIEQLPPLVGDPVNKGDVLARLDCSDFQLEVERVDAQNEGLKARLDLAQRQYDRADSLKGSSSMSEQDYDQRRAEVQALSSELRAARVALKAARSVVAKCVIRAPFDGIVLERVAGVGELPMPGAPLLRLLDYRNLELSAQILAEDVAGLPNDGVARFELGNARFPVRLRRLLPVINTLSGNQEARFNFTAAPPPVGAVGRLVWRDPQPYLPAELLVGRQGQLGVFLGDAGAARFHPLPGAQEGRPAAFQLPPDTPIVTDGRFLLEDGVPLR